MKIFRDVLLALSLANLLFLNRWLYSLDNSLRYFNYTPPNATFFLALLTCIGLCAVVLVFLARVVRWCNHPILYLISSWGITVVLMLEAMALRKAYVERYAWLGFGWYKQNLGIIPAYIILVIGISVFLYILLRYRNILSRSGIVIVLVFSPFIIATFSQAIIRIANSDGFTPYAPQQSAPFVPNKSKALVLYMVFDEMGFHEAFENRPSHVHLPAFDRLKSESLFATSAYSPGSNTVLAMPGLIGGRRVVSATPHSSNELLLQFEGEKQRVPWSKQPNMFSEARKIGVNSAFVGGWRHPYARIIGHTTNSADYFHLFDTKGLIENVSEDNPFTSYLRSHLIDLFNQFLSLPNQSDKLEKMFPEHFSQIRKYVLSYTDKTKISLEQKIADGRYGLIFVHWVVPHTPWVYSFEKNSPVWDQPGDGYSGNLVMADRILSDVRSMLESKGLWNNTSLIITADHWNRASTHGDHRVPLLIKLPSSMNEIQYGHFISTEKLHDIVLRLVAGNCDQACLKQTLDVTMLSAPKHSAH